MKQVRWKCERCGDGCLAPSKPRRDDVRRYCLPCSKESGRLVERISPSLEAQRAKKQEQRRAAAKRKRATVAKKREAMKPILDIKRDASKFGECGMPIQKEAERIWKLFEPYHRGRQMPSIRVTWKRSTIDEQGRIVTKSMIQGLANYGMHEVILKPRPSWGTLAHELCHFAVGYRYGESGRRAAHDEVFYRALKDIYEKRWKKPMDWSKVTKYGYAVDGIMERQIFDEVEKAWKK